MFVPSLYRETDKIETLSLIRKFPFATIITTDESGPYINHLPVLLDETGPEPRLIGHLSTANPQLKHLEAGQEVTVVFNGPNAYISPSWYRGKEHVPTWNYAVVHVRGKSRVVSGERLREILDRSVALFETTPGAYRFSENPDLPASFQSELMRAIAGFEIEMTHIDTKFKLGQNRNTEDYVGVIEGLGRCDNDMARGVRELMIQRMETRSK